MWIGLNHMGGGYSRTPHGLGSAAIIDCGFPETSPPQPLWVNGRRGPFRRRESPNATFSFLLTPDPLVSSG
jgi:hypothetical protein